jgi:hypothetical protein
MLANKKSETTENCVGRNFGQVLTIRGIETGITAGPATGRTLLKTDTKSGSSEAEDQLAKILLVEYRIGRMVVNVLLFVVVGYFERREFSREQNGLLARYDHE